MQDMPKATAGLYEQRQKHQCLTTQRLTVVSATGRTALLGCSYTEIISEKMASIAQTDKYLTIDH
jgi:hypothetical protein